MRIGMIAPPWASVPPAGYGGIELVVDLLARGLQAEGHTVVLFTTGDSSCPVTRKWRLPCAEGERIGFLAPELEHVIAAYDALGDCDIIHDHTVLGPHYGARRTSIPIVTTAHGPLDSELEALYRPLSHDDVSLVAISRAQRAAAPQVPVRSVIHHGIEAAHFPVGRGDGDFLVFLGRMSPDKGVHLAMDAAARAGRRLVIAAKMREPAEQAYFSEFVRPRLSRDLEYIGEVEHAEKCELLASAAGLLFPICWSEPFGMVMLEAMACGTPVLAFARGAVPEVVRDGRTGFLCANVDHMASMIGHIDELDRGECRAAAEGYFSAMRMVRQHIKLYQDVIAERHAADTRAHVVAMLGPQAAVGAA